jgi:hypothetical protein
LFSYTSVSADSKVVTSKRGCGAEKRITDSKRSTNKSMDKERSDEAGVVFYAASIAHAACAKCVRTRGIWSKLWEGWDLFR